jgi:hypothetical protein
MAKKVFWGGKKELRVERGEENFSKTNECFVFIGLGALAHEWHV